HSERFRSAHQSLFAYPFRDDRKNNATLRVATTLEAQQSLQVTYFDGLMKNQPSTVRKNYLHHRTTLPLIVDNHRHETFRIPHKDRLLAVLLHPILNLAIGDIL